MSDGYVTVTTLREKLIKIGAKVVRHAVYVTVQMAEVALARKLFRRRLRFLNQGDDSMCAENNGRFIGAQAASALKLETDRYGVF